MTEDTAVAFQHTISAWRCALCHCRLYLARRGVSAHQYYFFTFCHTPKRLLNVDGSGGLCLFVMCIVPPHDTDGSSGVSAHRLRWEMCVVPPPPSSGQTWLFSTPVLQPHITSSLCVWLVSKEKTHPRLKRKMAAVKRNGRFTSSTFHLITDVVSFPPLVFRSGTASGSFGRTKRIRNQNGICLQ